MVHKQEQEHPVMSGNSARRAAANRSMTRLPRHGLLARKIVAPIDQHRSIRLASTWRWVWNCIHRTGFLSSSRAPA